MIKMILVFFLGLFLGIASKDNKEPSGKMWITEKCGTNTPPSCCPEYPSTVSYSGSIGKMRKD